MNKQDEQTTTVDLLSTMDANVWAKEFVKLYSCDLDTIRVWFANAIMCGFDHANNRHQAHKTQGDHWANEEHARVVTEKDAEIVFLRLQLSSSNCQYEDSLVELRSYDQLLDEKNAQLTAANEIIGKLESALNGLHDDVFEYQKINNLGGFKNHWMQAARAALAELKEYRGNKG